MARGSTTVAEVYFDGMRPTQGANLKSASKSVLSALVGTAIAGAPLFAAGPAAAEDTLRIGTEGAYPPFNFRNAQGELTGFDVDFARALCAAMNARCELQAEPWDSIIPGLLEERYDASQPSPNDVEQSVEDFVPLVQELSEERPELLASVVRELYARAAQEDDEEEAA